MLTAVDKMRINKYLKEHAVGDIYYGDMCDALSKRGKVKDVEFLEYFVSTLITEFRKDTKLQMKYITKLTSVISAFLGWVHDDNSEVSEELLDRIRNLENYYDDYLNRTNEDIDLEYTEKYLTVLMDGIKELYPQEKESNESLVEYLKELDDLRKEASGLRRQLESLQSNYESLQGQFEDKSQSLIQSNVELGKFRATAEKQAKTIEELRGTVDTLEQSLVACQQSITDLEPFKADASKLAEEVLALTAEIQRRDKVQRDLDNKQRLEVFNADSIYRLLLDEKLTIDEISKKLKKEGFILTNAEIYDLLKKLRTKISIEKTSFRLTPEYSICEPKIIQDSVFPLEIPDGCKHYDFMLTSDFHIDSFIGDKLISGMDRLFEYCVSQNIKMILNLGDLFHGRFGKSTPYEEAVANYRCVEKAISILPRSEGIYHAVLGGNHDMKMHKFGFDPLEMLAREREDFINLGYTRGIITFDGNISALSSFGIHHPSSFDFDVDLDDDGLDTTAMIDDLSKFYRKLGKSRNDSYVDIFGHTHRSLINNPESYVFVPPLFGKAINKGATHLRVYFDDDKKIKYMVFMPLNVSEKVRKTTEVVYQKTLTKK